MPKSGQYINGLNPMTEQDLENLYEAAEDIFNYHEWTDKQKADGAEVREALKNAFIAIVKHVPASADRAVALRKLREARMDANSAITHDGKY